MLFLLNPQWKSEIFIVIIFMRTNMCAHVCARARACVSIYLKNIIIPVELEKELKNFISIVDVLSWWSDGINKLKNLCFSPQICKLIRISLLIINGKQNLFTFDTGELGLVIRDMMVRVLIYLIIDSYVIIVQLEFLLYAMFSTYSTIFV